MTNGEPDKTRQEEIIAAVLKVVGIGLAVGLFIGLVTWVVVKSLDLNSTDVSSLGPGPIEPITTLPTTALPQPSDSASPSPETETPTPSDTPLPTAGTDGLFLNASPVFVSPMERINLTGQWAGQDALSLEIQRFEDGEWRDFGPHVQVRLGSFATYVMTGREGENKFRVFDPATNSASNEVVVTVG